MAGDVVQLSIDAKTVMAVSGISFSIIGFLLVILAKVIVSGINKTITNCHDSLSTEHEHLGEKHENHETRISNIEKAVFKPIGGGNG